MIRTSTFVLPIVSVVLVSNLLGQPSRSTLRNTEITLGSLVLRRDVQNELDLLDEQRAEIAAAQQEAMKTADAAHEVARNLDDSRERSAILATALTQANVIFDSSIRDILTQQQVSRLEQIVLRSRYKAGGIQWVLNSADVCPKIETLEISDEQLKEIERRSDDAESTKQRRLQELRNAYHEGVSRVTDEIYRQVLEPLTAEQRRKINELMGAPFDVKANGVRQLRQEP
jgi:hypothetical protein